MNLTAARSAVELAEREYHAAEGQLDAARAQVVQATIALEADPSGKVASKLVTAKRAAEEAGDILAAHTARRLAARFELERVQREDQQAALTDAIERTRHTRVYERTAPMRAKLLALFAEVATTVSEIETEISEQQSACLDATEIAKALGTHAAAARQMSPTFARAMVGVSIAQALYATGRKFEIGLEPWTWLAARAEPPSQAPHREEWRRAKQAAIGEAFLPAPRCDFHRDLATTEFFHEPRREGRAQRWETET